MFTQARHGGYFFFRICFGITREESLLHFLKEMIGSLAERCKTAQMGYLQSRRPEVWKLGLPYTYFISHLYPDRELMRRNTHSLLLKLVSIQNKLKK